MVGSAAPSSTATFMVLALSPTPTVSVKVPAPKVSVFGNEVSAISLCAVARDVTSTWCVPFDAAALVVPRSYSATDAVSTSSVLAGCALPLAVTVRVSKAVVAFSAVSAVFSLSKAEVTVPIDDSCILALDCCRFSALSAGLRSAATSWLTMLEISSPEPMPPYPKSATSFLLVYGPGRRAVARRQRK
ncbi:hypothetical protein G6F68_012366 [Rhizopus microsporus]|nr:hypothetical protein G6F68_012366 [Rhizopus microsporus]